MTDKKNPLFFFSISADFIPVGRPIPFDIYINSSSNSSKPHYVKIVNLFETLNILTINVLVEKYATLYVAETQRAAIFHEIEKSNSIEDTLKINFYKNFISEYLKKHFFNSHNSVESEYLTHLQDSLKNILQKFENKNLNKTFNILSNLAAHDFYTLDHSINVSIYSFVFFSALFPKSKEDEKFSIALAGLLHDIGKTYIHNGVLNKPDKFTLEEFEEIKKHPIYGLEIIDNCLCEYNAFDQIKIKNVISQHHENLDGSGYPNKLISKDISLEAKIVAIADFFDAITTKRPYCNVLSVTEALHLMEKSCEKKIDSHLFDIFKKHMYHFHIPSKTNLELAETFDQCIPNNKLPLVKITSNKPQSSTKKELNNFRVLIIDDDESLSNLISIYLRKINSRVEITFCNCGDTARNILFNSFASYDFVLLDIMLPDSMGTEILEELNSKNKINYDTKIYFISSNDVPITIKPELNFVSGYIKKPITYKQIESIFYDLLKLDIT